MFRRLVNAAAIVSAIFCILAVAIWIRSQFREDELGLNGCGQNGRTWYALASGNGWLGFEMRVRYGGPIVLPPRLKYASNPSGLPYMISAWHLPRDIGIRDQFGFLSLTQMMRRPPFPFAEYRQVATARCNVLCCLFAALPLLQLSGRIFRGTSGQNVRLAIIFGTVITLAVGITVDAYLAPPSWGLQDLAWLGAAVTGTGISILFSNWLARRQTMKHRSAEGLCAHCGYDLRASSIRCPECGKSVILSGTAAE